MGESRKDRFLRRAFRLMNKGFMVPAFRLGLGPLLGSPYGGYIMVIKTRGWKSGRTRYTPVDYAIANGLVYCIAGFGDRSHWIKNLRAEPEAELLLPGGALACRMETVEDEAEKRQALRQVLVNSGFAVYAFEGINPHRVTDMKLAELLQTYRILRFRPTGIGAGAYDPGGWFWLWPVAATVLLIWSLLR
jgi:deazaflavin-dependent oxidoreductase (nitroreductase family)